MASKQTLGFVAVVAGGFAIGLLASLSLLAARIDHYAHDTILSRLPPDSWTPQSVVVAIDEATLSTRGGPRKIRMIVAEALNRINAAHPRAVASDVVLHDEGDPSEDAVLEASLRATKNLILPCELVRGKWEDPLPRFKALAVSLGHVHPEDVEGDGVSRKVPLELTADGQRRWALSLEAFHVAQREPIVESPDDVQIGTTIIPAARNAGGRPMWIRYLKSRIPLVSAIEIDRNADALRDKTVFLGVTALTMARDRLINPYGDTIPGVAVHAHAFETMARGRFFTPASDTVRLLLCALFAIAAGLIFSLRSGWQAYVLGALLLVVAHWVPFEFFRRGVVFPYFAPVSIAWLSTVGAATFQHFFVRKQLRRSESEKSRYQQAIHWAAHEMRTPLTAIQGSSEIMTRYSLPDEKRNQLSEMINSESKRLARMIQTFLDVERLADGHMELKRESFAATDVVATCMKRAAPIADRKKISVSADRIDGTITGDRELMEYAFYNLLTNAVKYSPAETNVRVTGDVVGGELRLSVRDQGIGMDSKELKSIFKKFYRTKRAEESGEVGTGIGLSIVEQIVTHHGGRMEVTSQPGKGSCFTMIIAATSSAAATSQHADTLDRRG